MAFFDRLNTRAVTWNRVYGDGTWGPRTASGTSVSEVSALKYSIVWASVTLIADALSSLEPEAFRLDDQNRRISVPVPRWVAKPSQTYRRNDIISQLLMSALLWGNGYALLVRRDSDGVVVGMTVLDPTEVDCEWDERRPGFRKYRVNLGPWLTEGDVLHLQGPTLPGRPTGLSAIGQARESIALGLTLEEFGARYFSQGSHQKVVIKVPGKTLPENEARDLVRQYEQFTRGAGNWHRPSVLSGKDVDIVNISIPPEDAQFLQSREFQAIDVARWFRLPPHRVGILSVQTSWGTGLAEENTALVQNTYRPWIDRLEAMLTFYSPGGEDSGIRIKLNVSDLLRGSFKDMVDAWGAAVEKKIVTQNEARKALGLDPIDGGDEIQTDPVPPAVQTDTQLQEAAQRFLDESRGNTHHDAKGKFAQGGGFKASSTQHKRAIRLARDKINKAPVPSESAVKKAREELALAKAGKGRAGGDSRGGSSKDRAKQRLNLFNEFGGKEHGHVPCHGCGVKMHHSDKPEDNPNGYTRFERGKIFTKAQGGGYQLPNLLPECFSCNRGRNDKPIRKENLPNALS